MHLRGVCAHLFPEIRREGHAHAPARFTIKECAVRDLAAEHFLQAHGLGAQLQLVAAVLFGVAALILDRIGQPCALVSVQRHAAVIPAKLHDVALTGEAERQRVNAQAARDDRVAAALAQLLIVGALVQKRALRGAQVLCPLLLDMDQRPLPPAEPEVLQAGDHQAVVGVIHRQSLPEPDRRAGAA